MGSLLDSLGSIGVNVDPGNALSGAIENFTAQNLSPTDIFAAASAAANTVGGITRAIAAPLLSKLPIPVGILNQVPSFGQNGAWESSHYADDLNQHHGKYKFLFKVLFSGFGVDDFYCFVHRCDKPKVRFNHQDVNYYNFRSRVLISQTYDPLSVTFIDEIGNSVNRFFVEYMKKRSGTGGGNFGINTGFGVSSSTKSYTNGYADKGQSITIEQIFGNGVNTNRFTFVNARVESFDFDELNMEDNAVSMMTMSFSYDAILASTLAHSTAYRWGQTDIHAGGGTSGPENAGNLSGNRFVPTSATGKLIGPSNAEGIQSGLQATMVTSGANITAVATSLPADTSTSDDEPTNVVNSDMESSLKSIKDGSNLSFGGNPAAPTTEAIEQNNSGVTDTSASTPPTSTSSGVGPNPFLPPPPVAQPDPPLPAGYTRDPQTGNVLDANGKVDRKLTGDQAS